MIQRRLGKQFLFAAILVLAGSAFAQTSSSTIMVSPSTGAETSAADPVRQESVIKVDETLAGNKINKKFAEDKDITDTKLKADSGSLSKYSLKVSLSFYGPPLGDLTNEKQPNPDGSIGNNDTALGGSVSLRYRFDSKSALSAGTGINYLTPFHGYKRTDVKTPFVSYDRNARVGDFQMRNSYGASVATTPEYRDVGQYGTLSYDNSFVYNFGTTRIAAGLDTGLSYFLYEREYIKKTDKTAGRLSLGFYPQVKYNISDKMNVYTSLAFNFLNPRSRDDEFALLNRTLSQRLGMGVAFTRDIYFAPYLNFYPKDIRTDTTTLSFSTIFSIL